MKFFYELVWLSQRLFRRKIGIAKISKPSISINQVESSILVVSNSLRGKRVLNDYKQPLHASSKIIKLRAPILNPKTGVMWSKKQIIEESVVSVLLIVNNVCNLYRMRNRYEQRSN